MRYGISLLALLFALSVSTVPLYGQGRGRGQANKPTAGAKPGSPKADRARPVVAKAPKTERVAKTTKVPRATSTTPPTADVTPTTPMTARVKNPRLEARLLGLLPAGTTVQDASQGFKNWGQFVAAVHVSNNLNIPFADLKAKMTGFTPGATPGTIVQTAPVSLGQALQSLKGAATTTAPDALSATQIQTEVKKAEDAATADLRRTRDRS